MIAVNASSANTETIHLSDAALSAWKAASREAIETADHTAQETRGGDQQTQWMMARYAAHQAMQT